MAEFCKSVRLSMPESFPCGQLTTLRWRVTRRFTSRKPQAWAEFAGASNLIAWRFRSYVESANTLSSMPSASPDDIYHQEQTMFLAVCSAVSCIEAIAYATWALASDPLLLDVAFGPEEQRQANPSRVRDMLVKHTTDVEVTQPWIDVNNANEWQLLRELRIRMFHRTNLPRMIRGTSSAPPVPLPMKFAPTSTTPALGIDQVAALEPWLANIVSALLGAALAIVQIPPPVTNPHYMRY
jgi:hypothetical protein